MFVWARSWWFRHRLYSWSSQNHIASIFAGRRLFVVEGAGYHYFSKMGSHEGTSKKLRIRLMATVVCMQDGGTVVEQNFVLYCAPSFLTSIRLYARWPTRNCVRLDRLIFVAREIDDLSWTTPSLCWGRHPKGLLGLQHLVSPRPY